MGSNMTMTNTMSVFSFIPPLTMPCLAVGAHYSHVLWTRHNKCFIMQFLKMQPLMEEFKDAHEKFHREMHFSGLVPILCSKAPSMPLPAAGLVIYTPSRNFLAHPLWQLPRATSSPVAQVVDYTVSSKAHHKWRKRLRIRDQAATGEA